MAQHYTKSAQSKRIIDAGFERRKTYVARKTVPLSSNRNSGETNRCCLSEETGKTGNIREFVGTGDKPLEYKRLGETLRELGRGAFDTKNGRKRSGMTKLAKIGGSFKSNLKNRARAFEAASNH